MSFASGSPPYKKALQIQAVLEGDILSASTHPKDRAASARVWSDLEKLKRIMRGLPATTSSNIKVEAKPPKPRPYLTGPIEE